MLVYVAGPISAPTRKGMQDNMERAMVAGCRLFEAGHTAFVPHTSCAMHQFAHRTGLYAPTWEEWMMLDLRLLPLFDALLRLPGASLGADLEVQRAEELGIRVYTDIAALTGLAALIRGEEEGS